MVFHPDDLDFDLFEAKYAALDIETTGVSFRNDRICEIAIVTWRVGEKTEEFSSLVNPGLSISEMSYSVHGITNSMVTHSPTFREIADKVYEMLKDSVIIGHNVLSVDLSFLNKELREAGKKPLYNFFIDTYLMSKKIVPGLKRRSLKCLAQALDIKVDTLHRALPDARLVMKIWRKILDRFRHEGITCLKDMREMGLLDGKVKKKAKDIMELARIHGLVRIVYLSPFSGRTMRNIEPLSVRGNKLDAYCHLREDFRTFELNRIIDYRIP